MKFNWEALCRMDWILDFTDRNIHLYIENGHSTAPARSKATTKKVVHGIAHD